MGSDSASVAKRNESRETTRITLPPEVEAGIREFVRKVLKEHGKMIRSNPLLSKNDFLFPLLQLYRGKGLFDSLYIYAKENFRGYARLGERDLETMLKDVLLRYATLMEEKPSVLWQSMKPVLEDAFIRGGSSGMRTVITKTSLFLLSPYVVYPKNKPPQPGVQAGLKGELSESTSLPSQIPGQEGTQNSVNWLSGNWSITGDPVAKSLQLSLGLSNVSLLGGVENRLYFGGVGINILSFPFNIKLFEGGEQQYTISLMPGLDVNLASNAVSGGAALFTISALSYAVNTIIRGKVLEESHFLGRTYLESSSFLSKMKYVASITYDHLYALFLSPFQMMRDWFKNLVNSAKNVGELYEALSNPSEEEINRRWTIEESQKLLHTIEKTIQRGNFLIAKGLVSRFLKYKNLSPLIMARLLNYRDELDILLTERRASLRMGLGDVAALRHKTAEIIAKRLAYAQNRLKELVDLYKKNGRFINYQHRKVFLMLVAYLQSKLTIVSSLSRTMSPAYFGKVKNMIKGTLEVYEDSLEILDKDIRKPLFRKHLSRALRGHYNLLTDTLFVLGLASRVANGDSLLASVLPLKDTTKNMLVQYGGIDEYISNTYFLDTYNGTIGATDYLVGGGIANKPFSTQFLPSVFGEGSNQILKDMRNYLKSSLESLISKGWSNQQRYLRVPILGPLLVDMLADDNYSYIVGNSSLEMPQLIREASNGMEEGVSNLKQLRSDEEEHVRNNRTMVDNLKIINEEIASLSKKRRKTKEERQKLLVLLLEALALKVRLRKEYTSEVYDYLTVINRLSKDVHSIAPLILTGKAKIMTYEQYLKYHKAGLRPASFPSPDTLPANDITPSIVALARELAKHNGLNNEQEEEFLKKLLSKLSSNNFDDRLEGLAMLNRAISAISSHFGELMSIYSLDNRIAEKTLSRDYNDRDLEELMRNNDTAKQFMLSLLYSDDKLLKKAEKPAGNEEAIALSLFAEEPAVRGRLEKVRKALGLTKKDLNQ